MFILKRVNAQMCLDDKLFKIVTSTYQEIGQEEEKEEEEEKRGEEEHYSWMGHEDE